MEQIVAYLMHVDMTWVYAAVFLIAFIENIFPPFPSDVVVVFAGSLVAIGRGDTVLTVALATAGGTLGFMTMYAIGARYGWRMAGHRTLRFLHPELIPRAEHWFQRFGYWVVVANRFLAGTRAVVSFCAGMARLPLAVTTLLSAVSAALWYIILVALGRVLGENWKDIIHYLDLYSTIVSILLALGVAFWFVLRHRRRRRVASREEGEVY
jgi:membrane protein DedA with SNARE-associated domain